MLETGDISKKPLNELTNQQISGKLALINDSIAEVKSTLEFLEHSKASLKEEMARRKQPLS